ncbi:MAG: hypothetical protein HOW73_32965 [Polyangiaceae bacterium]|nr:hypothetical protein [Polyangiaceae bacterium]
MSCVTFCADLGLELTTGQRAFVRVAIDGAAIVDLDAEERIAAIAMFGDLQDVPRLARRTVVAAMGRDSGKTELAAAIGLYKALTVPLDGCGPGDIPRAFVVAPDTDTARVTIERAIARLEESETLQEHIVDTSKDSITIRRHDGRLVRLQVKAATRGGKSIRGRSIVCLILDEAALFYGDGYAVNDAEIVKAGRPRLLAGGVILLMSTPWAEDGLFFDLFAKNHGTPTTALVARASTLVMRDHDPDVAERIALERSEDPDNAAREYDAEFIAGGSSLFFDPDALAAAIGHAFDVTARARLAAGADLALVKDSSALAIVAADMGDEEGEEDRPEWVYGLVALEEERPERGKPLKLSHVAGSFCRTIQKYGLRSFVADGHVREPAREYTDAAGVAVEAAPEGREGKFETYVLTRKLLNEGRLVLLDHPRLLAQLRAVRSKPMPGGGFQLTSPRRVGTGHGDLVSALVLAVWAASRGGGNEGWHAWASETLKGADDRDDRSTWERAADEDREGRIALFESGRGFG